MYDNLFTPFTSYEAEMLYTQSPKEFKRIYSNMRQALRRRAKVFEKRGYTHVSGYQKIKEALYTTAKGADKFKNFSILSVTVSMKTTSYMGQRDLEKEIARNIENKYPGIKIPEGKEGVIFRLLDTLRQTRIGFAFYLTNKPAFWDFATKIVKTDLSFEEMFEKMLDYGEVLLE